MPELELSVTRREGRGKQHAKRLRREGRVPGILYGAGEDSVPFHTPNKELEDLLHTGGRHGVITVLFQGKGSEMPKTIIREIQQDPVTGDILHVDMLHVSLTEKIRVEVPVVATGVPNGVQNEGGVLEHLVHALEVECLPMEIPERIEVDVSDLNVGDSVHVQDLLEQEGRITTEPERAVFMVAPPTVALAEEEEEAEEEAEVMLEEETPTEPEVIGHGRSKEDEEE